MKRKLINFLILVFVGVCVYFGYNKFFGGDCGDSCESKDSTAVIVPAETKPDSTIVKKDSTAVKDTTKK